MGSRPAAWQAAQIVGNREGKSSIDGGVEPEVVETPLDQAAGDGPGHDVAGREVGQGVVTGHEGHALVVAQQRALAPQRLRQQRARHGRVVQRGGVELHELDVGHRGPGGQRHGHAVAGRQGGIRRHGVQLSGAAAGEDDVPRPDEDRGRRPAAPPTRPATRPCST